MEENYEIDAISDSPSRILSPIYFPSDVKKWMKKNAKPKMALKLMKVCKYFRHSDGFPYLVVKDVFVNGFEWLLETLDETAISNEDLETISKKLWIVGRIDIYGGPKDVSTLLSKIVVCNIHTLILVWQQITLDEFKLLTDGGMVEECFMDQTNIISENDEIVPLEDIFECLPNARIITFAQETPSFFSLEAAEGKISSKLEKLTLWIPPNNFDLQKLYYYMKNHQKIQYKLWFWGITKQEYEENIAPTVNKMIQEWSPKFKEPQACCSSPD